MKLLTTPILLALLALTGCATGPRIDHTYNAIGQSSRVRFIVLHYTVSDKEGSIRTLTREQVSAHYLLTDDPQPVIYGLVDESQQAWHAGVSNWKAFSQLNTSSVGIEIVNKGWVDTPQGRVYAPFTQAQIDTLIPLLKDIVARNHVAPENILGHSDIAPLRKQDPGPMFPWMQLAKAGLIAWPDATRVAAVQPAFEAMLLDVAWFQQKLSAHGYAIVQTGELDEQTRTVLGAFQMKYRPARYDGQPDAESAALLEVLTAPVPKLVPAAVPVPAAVSVPPAVPVPPAPAVPAATPAPAAVN